MSANGKCTMCGVGFPIARAALGKLVTPVVLNALDLRDEKTPLDRIIVTLVGLGVGHVVDKILAEALGPLCASCQAKQPA